ncbi:MAG: sulfite exporter TauE/SafE family protein, partial [Desulfosalsimonas sp.]
MSRSKSKIRILWFSLLSALLVCAMAVSAAAQNVDAQIDSQEYLAGDKVKVSGTIEPGEDLFIAIASEKEFATEEATGVNEIKRLQRIAEENPWEVDTYVPVYYYMITNTPEKFGEIDKKRFGGPSFAPGIYSTTMFNLADWDSLDSEVKNLLGPLDSAEEWAFFKFNHENGYGIDTITKERTQVGQVTIFSRSVITDYEKSGNYWDEGTSIDLDKETGEFTATFKTFRHTPPDTNFNVYVNGEEIDGYSLEG